MPLFNWLKHYLGVIKKKSQFVGKLTPIDKLRDIDATLYARGEYDDEFTVAEIYLSNF